jgi:hypothetical protein
LARVAPQQPTEVTAYFQVLRPPVVVEGGLVHLLLHKAAQQVVLAAVAAQHSLVLRLAEARETRHQQHQVRVITAATLAQTALVLLAAVAVQIKLVQMVALVEPATAATVLHLQLQARL